MIDDTLKTTIKDEYEKGTKSIQDIARYHRVTVEDVLQITDNADILTVETSGDMIDAEEAGNQPLNYGERHKTNFSLN